MLLLRRRYSDSTLCLPNHSHHSLSLSLSITLSSRTYFLSIYYSTTYSLLYLHIPIFILSTTLSHTLYIFTYILSFYRLLYHILSISSHTYYISPTLIAHYLSFFLPHHFLSLPSSPFFPSLLYPSHPLQSQSVSVSMSVYINTFHSVFF